MQFIGCYGTSGNSITKFVGFFGNRRTAYKIHNALPNAAKKLKGISGDGILTIAEFAYDVKSTDTVFRRKHYHKLVYLNKDCRASV